MNKLEFHTLRKIFAATIGMIALSASPCRAEKEFGSVREVVADAARELLDAVQGQPISIGEFTATGKRNLNSGPLIATLLREEFRNLKVTVLDEDAPFEIKGDYAFVESHDPAEASAGQKEIRLGFDVKETKSGRSVAKVPITRFLRNNAEIADILGVTGRLPLDPRKGQAEQRRERNRLIQQFLDRPTTFVDPDRPSLVASAKESPYRVELLAGPVGDGKVRPSEARPAHLEKGLAFVDGINRDDVVEVRITNNSPEEVAVAVFVDGLDMFHFSKDRDPRDPTRPRFTHMIVPPAQGGTPGAATIVGWHNSLEGKENFLAFLVTAYGKGASSKEGIPATGPVGIIQVQFSRCSEVSDEKRTKSASNEIGQGPPREVGGKAVVREIEPPTDFVSLRYSR